MILRACVNPLGLGDFDWGNFEITFDPYWVMFCGMRDGYTEEFTLSALRKKFMNRLLKTPQIQKIMMST